MSGTAKRLLIVDDEPYICEVLSRWLKAEGYECDLASSAEEAWEMLRGNGYLLLISDITMPGMSGTELLALTKERYPDMAVILVTGVDDRQTAVSALEAGAFGYVIKPFNQNEVLINVANALERRRLVLASKVYENHLENEVRERTADVRNREEEIALRLVSASEYRDEETGAHIKRIGLFAEALARALGWAGDVVDDIRVAAPMHDIGKIGIPDTILLKPGKLTSEEFETIKTHCEVGAGILGDSSIPLLKMANEIAYSHHEKWDGAGYPRGLAGRAIPSPARAVAVADVYDALSRTRVYRDAFPEGRVLEIMADGRNSHFDPEVYDCFLDILPELCDIQKQVKDEEASKLRRFETT